jgi:general secretion pathway protein G
VRFHLQPRLDALLRCAFCHGALAPPESVCSRCFTRLHVECRAALSRCPTLGCVSVVVRPRPGEPDPRLEDRSYDRIGCFPKALVALVLFVLLVWLATDPTLFLRTDGTNGAATAQIASFEAALDFFQADCGRFPTTAEGLEALRTPPPGVTGWKGPYMRKAIPLDPWGNPYRYVSPGSHILDRGVATEFDLSSFGPDGEEGTPDDVCSCDFLRR